MLPAACPQLVGQYLFLKGYTKAYEALCQACPLAAVAHNSSATATEERKAATSLVRQGRPLDAVQLVSRTAPSVVLPASPVLFELFALEFTLILARGDPHGALVFAQQHLRAYAASGTPEQKERLQDLMALIAYEHPETSPVGHLMALSEASRVADVLNGALLLACGLPQHAALETIVRHTTAVRERLHVEGAHPAAPPRWSLSSQEDLSELPPGGGAASGGGRVGASRGRGDGPEPMAL